MIPKIPTNNEEYQSFLLARASYLAHLIQLPSNWWANDHLTFSKQRETFMRFTDWNYFSEHVRFMLKNQKTC